MSIFICYGIKFIYIVNLFTYIYLIHKVHFNKFKCKHFIQKVHHNLNLMKCSSFTFIHVFNTEAFPTFTITRFVCIVVCVLYPLFFAASSSQI